MRQFARQGFTPCTNTAAYCAAVGSLSAVAHTHTQPSGAPKVATDSARRLATVRWTDSQDYSVDRGGDARQVGGDESSDHGATGPRARPSDGERARPIRTRAICARTQIRMDVHTSGCAHSHRVRKSRPRGMAECKGLSIRRRSILQRSVDCSSAAVARDLRSRHCCGLRGLRPMPRSGRGCALFAATRRFTSASCATTVGRLPFCFRGSSRTARSTSGASAPTPICATVKGACALLTGRGAVGRTK